MPKLIGIPDGERELLYIAYTRITLIRKKDGSHTYIWMDDNPDEPITIECSIAEVLQRIPKG